MNIGEVGNRWESEHMRTLNPRLSSCLMVNPPLLPIKLQPDLVKMLFVLATLYFHIKNYIILIKGYPAAALGSKGRGLTNLRLKP